MQTHITSFFEIIPDPRSHRNQKHNFISIVCTAIFAVLSGIDSFLGIQEFVEAHFDELSKMFDLSNGVPSHDTYRRIFSIIDPQSFWQSFQMYLSHIQKTTGDLINIDGKTIRNSGKKHPLHIVSAWCTESEVVFAQAKVKGKSNEITAIPEVLNQLDLNEKIVTIDAIGTQRDICQQIIDHGGDYVIALKGNQPTLYDDVQLFLEDPENYDYTNENNDKGHGRIERRCAAVSHNIGWLQERHQWPGLKAIGKITATVWKKDKKTGKLKETTETRHYISSIPLDANKLNDIARKHWSIENVLHWRLDVCLNEDKACIRNDNAAENMDIMRKWALAILKDVPRKPGQSTKSLMRKNAMSFKHLSSCLRQIFHA